MNDWLHEVSVGIKPDDSGHCHMCGVAEDGVMFDLSVGGAGFTLSYCLVHIRELSKCLNDALEELCRLRI